MRIPDPDFSHPGSRICNIAFYFMSYEVSLNFQFDSCISGIPVVLGLINSLHDLKEYRYVAVYTVSHWVPQNLRFWISFPNSLQNLEVSGNC